MELFKKVRNFYRDILSGNNRVAERNSVAIVACEIQSRRTGFDPVHQIFESPEANVVLGNRFPEDGTMLERRLAPHTEKLLQVFQHESIERAFVRESQLRFSTTAQIARDGHVAFRGA